MHAKNLTTNLSYATITSPMSRTVLITGGTAGIGQACARLFAENGWRIIVTGRRQERLDELAKELSDSGVEVHTLCFDIQDHTATKAAIESLPDNWSSIDALINNAGLALGKELFYEGSPDDWDTMIDTNIKGLLYMSRCVAPQMVKRGSGHIINLGSIAGKEAYKGGAVYNATKFAVDALTKAMRIDLLEHSVRVTSICPGAVETEFSTVRFKGDESHAKSVYEGYQPLRPEDIADAVWYAASRPDHVNINDMLIMPTAQANTTHLHKQ